MKKILSRSLISIICTGLAAFALSMATLAWFTTPGGSTDKENVDGEVGLRGYFYSGDGSYDWPFEIVSPIHFYNLTRLQNLGVFTQRKTYFKVGHIFENDTTPKCLNIVDGVQVPQPWLDMGDFCATNTVLPIGGEGAPFIGDFDGQGIPIKNLKISGYPEDIGVFGYVSFEGVVKGLVCENLEIHSLGYTQTPPDSSTTLFMQDVDDIFNSASYLATDTSLDFIDNNSADPINHLKSHNGLGGTTVSHVNQTGRVINNNEYVYNGYFIPTFPQRENDPFTYSWKTSSSLLKKCDSSYVSQGLTIPANTINKAIIIDMEDLALSSDSEDKKGFNCGKEMQVDVRLSLIASVEIGGFTYSRVIQSYKLEFYSNSSIFSQGNYSVSMFCDYLETYKDPNLEKETITNYHHGNNIGFLAGHVDGTITDSYVYMGKLFFNDENKCHEIKTETETGLVGEIGTNVANSINPDFGLTTHGDTGIINYTKIFENIRSKAVVGDTVDAGYMGAPINVAYYSYYDYRNTGENKYSLFQDYLRYWPDDKHSPITSLVQSETSGLVDYSGDGSIIWHDYNIPAGTDSNAPNSFNSVDFLWNAIIQDETNKDRGMGVFKIVSNYLDTSDPNFKYADHMFDFMGKCRISTGAEKTKVYFSTAEYDHTVTGQPTWGGGADQIEPLRPTTLPSYSDKASFEYPFSRDYNYCFELDLSQSQYADGKNFMYNTKSEFLANYLSSKLIDKFGGEISPKNPRFGFMFRSSDNEILSSLSSYMQVGAPGTKQNYGTEDDPVYYPSNSIVFRIENSNGANVSVVGNGNNDITIYSYDPTSSANDITPMYTMKNTKVGDDQHRFFKYTLSNGDTSGDTTTIVEPNPSSNNSMNDTGDLYAHIFKLPQGDYVIGSSGTANLYYLAVQGQTDASIGDNELAAIGNAITDVDFLVEAPTLSDYLGKTLKVALFCFKSDQNTLKNKMIEVGVNEDASHNKYVGMNFNNNPVFIPYLLLSSKSKNIGTKYYINSAPYDRGGSFVFIQT